MNNNNYNENRSPLYSWPVIILAMIIFFPVGIYLIYKRVKIDKMSGISNGKGVRYGSYFCFSITALGIIACLDNGFTSEDIGVIIFFLVSGVALFRFSKKLANNAEKYKKYIAIIINGNELILDNIAGAMSLSTKVVRKDLKNMINNGYFQGAYINDSTNEIVLPNKSKKIINETVSKNTQQVKQRVVKCKGCGAQNNITTSVIECEYCGSPL